MITARPLLVNEPCYVYRHYDAADRLLYVGSTHWPSKRMSGHKHSPWWPEVARVEISEPTSYVEAFHAEQQAIKCERPVHNKARVDDRSVSDLRMALAFRLAISPRREDRVLLPPRRFTVPLLDRIRRALAGAS